MHIHVHARKHDRTIMWLANINSQNWIKISSNISFNLIDTSMKCVKKKRPQKCSKQLMRSQKMSQERDDLKRCFGGEFEKSSITTSSQQMWCSEVAYSYCKRLPAMFAKFPRQSPAISSTLPSPLLPFFPACFSHSASKIQWSYWTLVRYRLKRSVLTAYVRLKTSWSFGAAAHSAKGWAFQQPTASWLAASKRLRPSKYSAHSHELFLHLFALQRAHNMTAKSTHANPSLLLCIYANLTCIATL